MAETTAESALERATKLILDPRLVRATIKRAAKERVTVRPVVIKGERMVQVSEYDGRKTAVANCTLTELGERVRPLLAGDVKSIVVVSGVDELRIQFSRKGRPILHARRVAELSTPSLVHDRVIARPLPEGEPDRLLQVIGLMTADGRVKADRRRKYVQINEFIRIVLDTADLATLGASPLLIVDYGCGNAYLSFALYHYLTDKLGIATELIGVDRTAEIIARNIAKAEELDAASIRFEVGDIAAHAPPRAPDIVTALHACDTATDAALAKALEYGAKLIFAAPCCHHHLQAQEGFGASAGALHPIFGDGILRERLGDLATDAFRALILRIAGYDVDVIEFTSPEHTAKNLLIRAQKRRPAASGRLVDEYRAMKAELDVTPYLEAIAPEPLRTILR